jgi:hypothetical protein
MDSKMKLTIGKDIILDKNERLSTYRNKINGIIYYTTSKYNPVFHDGEEFLAVFQKPTNPYERRVNYIARAALEKVQIA